MRSPLLALLVSLPAAAQISGVLTVSDGGHLTLDVRCEPACSPASSDLEWRFSALDGGGGFLATPALDGGHFETDAVVTQLGTALTFSTSASCTCGSNDGGVLELRSAPFPIAPTLELPRLGSLAQGAMVIVHGFPQGTETIELTYAGAGLDGGLTITHAGADFIGGNTTVVLAPTQPGTLTFNATLRPYGVSAVAAQELIATDGPDAHPDDQQRAPTSCSSAPGLLLVIALALARRTTRVPLK